MYYSIVVTVSNDVDLFKCLKNELVLVHVLFIFIPVIGTKTIYSS